MKTYEVELIYVHKVCQCGMAHVGERLAKVSNFGYFWDCPNCQSTLFQTEDGIGWRIPMEEKPKGKIG